MTMKTYTRNDNTPNADTQVVEQIDFEWLAQQVRGFGSNMFDANYRRRHDRGFDWEAVRFDDEATLRKEFRFCSGQVAPKLPDSYYPEFKRQFVRGYTCRREEVELRAEGFNVRYNPDTDWWTWTPSGYGEVRFYGSAEFARGAVWGWKERESRELCL